jgi:hypothetical protein
MARKAMADVSSGNVFRRGLRWARRRPTNLEPQTEIRPPQARSEGRDLTGFRDVFDGIEPFEGEVPKGYLVDFLGTMTDGKFRAYSGIDVASVGGRFEATRLPDLAADGEGWFEAVDWVVAAREASDRYVMVTLGACYGAQALGAYKALQLLNPMPFKLVAVEPVPENMEWTVKHFRDNGVNPDEHWLVPLALSHNHDPVFFPVGSPGSGAQNCYATNEQAAREAYVAELERDDPVRALRNLVLNNTTGLSKELVEGERLFAEIKMVSALTLREILAPFDRVDYVEADIQQSEILVFPPHIDLLRRKVRRIHIGTHGRDVHWALHDLFVENGWEVIFSFAPNSEFDTAAGRFSTNDGVLTVHNPDL